MLLYEAKSLGDPISEYWRLYDLDERLAIRTTYLPHSIVSSCNPADFQSAASGVSPDFFHSYE